MPTHARAHLSDKTGTVCAQALQPAGLLEAFTGTAKAVSPVRIELAGNQCGVVGPVLEQGSLLLVQFALPFVLLLWRDLKRNPRAGRWVALVILIMRVIDTFLAFPFLLLALAVMAVLKPGLWNLIMVLALTSWVPYARVARIRTRTLRGVEYVEAAHAMAAGSGRILRRHVMPNISSSLVVIACFEIGAAILAESTLSFLGLGISPDIPTWGMTLNEGRSYLLFAWWPTTIPGIFILLTVFGINLVGDGVRDATDPRLRR